MHLKKYHHELSVFSKKIDSDGVSMNSHSLMWAAVPHNSDGVAFQIRLVYGLQRFHISRGVLEKAFRLERKATDARQLELFYTHLKSIVAGTNAKRSIAGHDMLPLHADDFIVDGKEARWFNSHTVSRSSM
ncbi:MAG: FIG00462635: hypothetical protein [uncultured Paraburkholderia sp.]|nr:MAG: FIG00462635: hypothetical protein [uncultured Paraburkholderia sp.]CAH2911578.1 MAG: FIG00462635: hypothetical protein [uncultured Paraburkholderia sp.]